MGKNRNLKKSCLHCKKEFRSDYLPKHLSVCKLRPAKTRVVINSGIQKYLSVEAEHSDSEPDTLVIDTDSDDREFIDDEVQENDDQNTHRLADNKVLHDEVKRRLQDLGMKIADDAIAEKCDWCKEEVSPAYAFYIIHRLSE